MNRALHLLVALAALLLAPAAMAQERGPVVLAAASLQESLTEAADAWAVRGHPRPVLSFAASSALARQVIAGAPADLFLSADEEWMDAVAKAGLLRAGTRTTLLGNRLVLIAPGDSRIGSVSIGPGFELATLVGDGRIVTGDVRAVPVGRYAKAALEKLGSWSAVAPRFAMTENVRAALTLVARGEAALGIVYETDAKVEPGVKIVGAFPADSHPAIVYPVAATATAKPESAAYLAFLRSGVAKMVFEQYGFTFLVRPTS